ncbi:unnamed protein product [Arabidopsis lyrata]|nr:unnamed protein product [Arabidopsis lyrata]
MVLILLRFISISKRLLRSGCDRDVSIHAYIDKCSDELRREYEDAGFHIEFIPLGGKDARIRSMFLDMLLWAFESPTPTNVILLAKNIGDEIGNLLCSLDIRRHGILSSQTQPRWQIPSERHTWFLTSLFDGPNGSSQRLDNKKTYPREI